jgi:dolichyl-phosphate beta-glucosyltransferase
VLDLSIIIPAYNEAHRLPPYLASIREYYRGSRCADYEVVVVDDGSGDDTASIVRDAGRDWPQLRLLRHRDNAGKGEAIRTGMSASRGELVLLADADGATPIAAEALLREAIHRGADLAVGSRLIGRGESLCHRPWHRAVCGAAFASLAGAVLGLPVRDPQCGFKMIRREVGERLMRSCREHGYLLDAELLALATTLGYRIDEVAVSWTDVPGSRLSLLRDGGRMLGGLWRVRTAIRSYERRLHQDEIARIVSG